MKKALFTFILSVFAVTFGYSQTGEDRIHGKVIGEHVIGGGSNENAARVYIVQSDDMLISVETVPTNIIFILGDDITFTLTNRGGTTVKAVNLGRPQ
jgi:hypothetical protein